MTDQSNGVAYLFSSKYAVRAIVSLWSLLRDTPSPNWSGPVAIFTVSDESNRIGGSVTKDHRLKRIDHHCITLVDKRYNGGLLTKLKLFNESPFDHTLFVDADTLIVAPIDGIFLDAPALTLTQFADRTAQHPDVKQNVEQWMDIEAKLAARCLESTRPAINTGVFLFRRGDDQLKRWRQLAFRGADKHVPDEIAAQLLLPDFTDCRVLGDDWNSSPKYGRNPGNAKILHFHSSLHRETSEFSKKWRSMLREVWTANIGSIQSWGPRLDDLDLQ